MSTIEQSSAESSISAPATAILSRPLGRGHRWSVPAPVSRDRNRYARVGAGGIVESLADEPEGSYRYADE